MEWWTDNFPYVCLSEHIHKIWHSSGLRWNRTLPWYIWYNDIKICDTWYTIYHIWYDFILCCCTLEKLSIPYFTVTWCFTSTIVFVLWLFLGIFTAFNLSEFRVYINVYKCKGYSFWVYGIFSQGLAKVDHGELVLTI